MIADIIVDLQYGDCGKGKVTHHLLEGGNYTHCIRYNGGCNAGHTIYHEGKKFVTHHIPAGVFYGVKSIIGPGCVVNLQQFFNEINELEQGGIVCAGLIKIAKNAHIITDEHMQEDEKDTRIGTTGRGNGPAYRDKYDRTGVRATDVPELDEYTIDIYEELHNNENQVEVLLEGAQGFGLDIDWGDYPFVTSSHCTVAGALLNGIPPKSVRHVWGVAKAYETYVGAKDFQPKDQDIFNLIRKVGKEYGATTGRPRQCNWTDVNLLKRAANINGVTHIVINKMDVLKQLGTWGLRCGNDDRIKVKFTSEEEMRDYITATFSDIDVHFSYNPETI
mgnify:CR=1 FL=1